MLKCISLSFFVENHLDDSEFLKEILGTSLTEFKKLQDRLQFLVENPNDFSSEDFYQLIHKYKPTVSMLKMKSYPLYLKYGSGNHFLEYETFIEISDTLRSNLDCAILDLEKELLNHQ